MAETTVRCKAGVGTWAGHLVDGCAYYYSHEYSILGLPAGTWNSCVGDDPGEGANGWKSFAGGSYTIVQKSKSTFDDDMNLRRGCLFFDTSTAMGLVIPPGQIITRCTMRIKYTYQDQYGVGDAVAIDGTVKVYSAPGMTTPPILGDYHDILYHIQGVEELIDSFTIHTDDPDHTEKIISMPTSFLADIVTGALGITPVAFLTDELEPATKTCFCAYIEGNTGTDFSYLDVTYNVPASIMTVVPDEGYVGQHLPVVTITGEGFTGATTVSFGTDVTVNSFSVDSDTQITVDLTISPSASIGDRDVTVATATSSDTLTDGFSVLARPGPPPTVWPPSPWSGALYGTAGNFLGLLTNWIKLTIVKRVNSPDKMEIVLDGRHPLVSTFGTDCVIQFWRSNAALGIAPYKEAEGLCRNVLHDWNEQGQYIYTAVFAGFEDLLDRRVLLGGDDEIFASSGYPAETVMKRVVTVQCGLAGTRNIITNAMPNLYVESTMDRGPIYKGYSTGQRLLSYLQDVGDSKNMAFRVVQGTTPGTFKFRAYPNPYGSDRTATNVIGGRNSAGNIPLVFSEQRRNVEKLGYHLLREGEGNVCIDMDNQIVAIGPGESDSPWNHREFCIAVGPDDNPNDVADMALSKLIARGEIAVDAIQRPNCAYGRDYFLGDWVTAYMAAPGLQMSLTKAITEVTITVQRIEGQMDESVAVVFADRPIPLKDPLSESILNLSERMAKAERRLT